MAAIYKELNIRQGNIYACCTGSRNNAGGYKWQYHQDNQLKESITMTYEQKIQAIDNFIEQAYDLRKQAMEQGNEFSESNLVFKELRNAGYLDNLKALKAEIKSEELSLESLQVNEELLGKEYYDTRAKLSRTANNQAQLWQDGRFSIYLVKEREVDRIIDRLNQAFELEYCTKTPGRYDFSHFDGMPGKLPDRYFTISGKIMLY